MSVWHGGSHKKKLTGGRKRAYRKKRKFERGAFPAETILGERRMKKSRRQGGNVKIRVLSERQANISNPTTGKTENTEIIRVVNNPVNIDYDRRGVITKGTIIETKLGLARVVSRPGQHGLINAVLLPKEQ
ncbi:30S ribosomal protein S8e [Candidatus Bathyarchaeota archaeon]|nr:MAG: 30S ribosomal protein S8e [Candidatus Bathyarchaeota archaeon]